MTLTLLWSKTPAILILIRVGSWQQMKSTIHSCSHFSTHCLMDSTESLKIDIHDRGILQDTFNHLGILLGQRICFQSRSIRFSCCCLQIELSVNKISLRCDWPLTPPSTGMISPVIQRASLLQRNRIATSNVQWSATYCRWTRRSLPLPTSHPVPSIFIRFWLTRACLISSVIPRPLTIGVKTIPGQTQLTLMFSGPCWAAIARVIWMIAPFDVGYSRLGFPPSTWMILASTTYNQMERGGTYDRSLKTYWRLLLDRFSGTLEWHVGTWAPYSSRWFWSHGPNHSYLSSLHLPSHHQHQLENFSISKNSWCNDCRRRAKARFCSLTNIYQNMHRTKKLHGLRNSLFTRFLICDICLNNLRSAPFFVDHSFRLRCPLNVEVKEGNLGTLTR